MVPEPLLMCPARPTNTVGSGGRKSSSQPTQLPIVDSTIMQLGQVGRMIQETLVKESPVSSPSLSHSLSRGLSLLSLVSINGANKIFGIIFAIVLMQLGSLRLSLFVIRRVIKVFAKKDQGTGNSSLSTYRPRVIELPQLP
jgi:hypothetical protein